MVGVEGMSDEQLKKIQKQVNLNFKDLGLKTIAKIYKGKEFSKVFNKMDKTDAVAYIGSEKAVTEAVNKVDHKFAEFLRKDPDFGIGGKNNPEVSGNPWGAVENDKIIAINTEDTKAQAKSWNVTSNYAAAFNVVHGAGHNSWMDHEGGVAHAMDNAPIPSYSVMSSGDYINNGMLTIGSKVSPLSGYIKTINNQGVVRDSYIKRFSDNDPKPNKNIPIE